MVSVTAALVLTPPEQSWRWQLATAPCCSASNTAARLLECIQQIALEHGQLSLPPSLDNSLLGCYTGVASFTRECHQRVFVQYSGFVVGGFEDSGASHGSFRGGYEGEVLACDSEQDLPERSSEQSICKTMVDLTY